jgi:hypothetical protein
MRRMETCQPDACTSALQQTRSAADRLLDCSSRVVAADCLMPASRAYAVPRLDGIPAEYQFTGGIDAAARLALTLISAGLVDTVQWVQAGLDPFAFIARALRDFVEAHGGEELRKEFFFRLALVSDLDPYACDGTETGLQDEMYIILEPGSAGYVVLEPTLRLLSRAHPRLPIAFFDLFTGALNRWVRVYDYRDALERVEQLRQWYESDPDSEQVELPGVEAATPSCLRQKRYPLKPGSVERLLETVTNRRVRALVEGALELNTISQKGARPGIGERAEARLSDANPPVPALVAVFKKHDAIEGCFDDECQGMLECTPEPNVILPFRSEDPASVQETFRLLGVVCDVLRQASSLITAMMQLVD